MYENQTYEAIKNRMLNNVKGLDIREGSITNDLQSPKALELANLYFELDNLKNMFFLKNNSYELLDLKADEWGLVRKEGTKATGQVTFTGTANTLIENGSILEFDSLRFVLLNDVIIGQENSIGYLEATEIGSIFNVPKACEFKLTVANDNVTNITNIEAFSGGSNTETDEELINRFETYKKKISTSGNKNDYFNWTMEVAGVGYCKVYDAEDLGLAGNVKIVIADSLRTGAELQLINDVKAHIETKRPVGANVTVVSATEKPININANLTLTDGYELEQVKEEIKKNVIKHLYDNAFAKAYVSVARIGNVILDTVGVFDYTNFTVNGGTSNINLLDTEVAVLGEVVVL